MFRALSLAPQMMGSLSLSGATLSGVVSTSTQGSMLRRRNGNTPNRAMRGRITSKTGPKNFYKGRGCPSYGFHTRSGWLCMCVSVCMCVWKRENREGERERERRKGV